MLKVEKISKSYAGRKVISDLSFSIERGEYVGLYGENGIGKSTVAKLIVGEELPDEGKIYFENKILADKNGYVRSEASFVQLVAQQPFAALDPAQKLLDGLVEIIAYHHLAPRGKEKCFAVEQAKAMELEPFVLSHYPDQISGGEAQRATIAKALLFQPKLLILDESTSMLDVSTQANVLSAVKAQTALWRGAALVIGHDKKLLQTYCNRIIEL